MTARRIDPTAVLVAAVLIAAAFLGLIPPVPW
ncbi:hypothetical protein SAMN04489726_7073 [Allokutzneria albata]|uniref:Uncharacterized protein n=1 Tax=Allokutzneria albata TaxID=211114 RepID=A0A1H0C7P6_ALLAB|nr:hypothetical protein SAMN04489726_7073 [Allokutzneria albata]